MAMAMCPQAAVTVPRGLKVKAATMATKKLYPFDLGFEPVEGTIGAQFYRVTISSGGGDGGVGVGFGEEGGERVVALFVTVPGQGEVAIEYWIADMRRQLPDGTGKMAVGIRAYPGQDEPIRVLSLCGSGNSALVIPMHTINRPSMMLLLNFINDEGVALGGCRINHIRDALEGDWGLLLNAGHDLGELFEQHFEMEVAAPPPDDLVLMSYLLDMVLPTKPRRLQLGAWSAVLKDDVSFYAVEACIVRELMLQFDQFGII